MNRVGNPGDNRMAWSKGAGFATQNQRLRSFFGAVIHQHGEQLCICSCNRCFKAVRHLNFQVKGLYPLKLFSTLAVLVFRTKPQQW